MVYGLSKILKEVQYEYSQKYVPDNNSIYLLSILFNMYLSGIYHLLINR